MDAGILEVIKLYGPLGIGWIIAGYLGKFVLDRYDKDIESRVKLSTAIEGQTDAYTKLSNAVEGLTNEIRRNHA